MKKVFVFLTVVLTLSFELSAFSCFAQEKGLAGYWKFDEGKGETAKDASGNGNNGEVGAEWAKGKFGTCLYFSGDGAGSVVVQDNPSLQFGKSDFSIEAWFVAHTLDIDSDQKCRRLMDKTGFPQNWWVIDLWTEAGIEMEMGYQEGEKIIGGTTISDGRVPLKAWTHLVITVDRKNFKAKYYINGKLDSVKDIPRDFIGALDVEGQNLAVGSTWQPFIGLIDEVKIYKRAISPDEVKASYDKEKANRTDVNYETED